MKGVYVCVCDVDGGWEGEGVSVVSLMQHEVSI